MLRKIRRSSRTALLRVADARLLRHLGDSERTLVEPSPYDLTARLRASSCPGIRDLDRTAATAGAGANGDHPEKRGGNPGLRRAPPHDPVERERLRHLHPRSSRLRPELE